jgi:hypothetical protein
MSIRSRILFKVDVENYNISYDGKSYPLKVGVCGIFDTTSVHWDYYAISFFDLNSGNRLCADLAKSSTNITSTFSPDITNIKGYFRKYETQQEAEVFLNEFKIKWETGSNNTTQEIREEKLKEILNGSN